MPMQTRTIDRFLRTIEAICRSPDVRHFKVGYTCRPLKTRADQYFPTGWKHAVAIADRLPQSEALWLEQRLFDEICRNPERPSILYRKYDPYCRDKGYQPSSGGRGDDGCDTHTVYIAWTDEPGNHYR